MKLILLFTICAIFVSHYLIYQQVEAENISAERNLYEEALSECVNRELKYYAGTIPESVLKKRIKNRFVEYNESLTEGLSTELGEVTLQYLNMNTLKEKFKRERREIPILKILPMQSDGVTIEIEVEDNDFSYKNEKTNYSLKSGCTVRFSFESEKNQFALKEVQLWGL
jgi:hypothetical protein